jgi:hypothetical protein
MIKSITTLNRKAGPGHVVLIHGLFANSGYWLPYLRMFKNEKISLIDLDYEHLLKSGSLECVLSELREIDANKIIGHSFGSILASRMQSAGVDTHIICPVLFSSRKNEKTFKQELKTKLEGVRFDHISEILRLSGFFLKGLDGASVLNEKIGVHLPYIDLFFEYSIPKEAKVSYYQGDHFDIFQAISNIQNASKPRVIA